MVEDGLSLNFGLVKEGPFTGIGIWAKDWLDGNEGLESGPEGDLVEIGVGGDFCGDLVWAGLGIAV